MIIRTSSLGRSGEAGDRKTRDLKQARVCPIVAQDVEEEEWREVWDPERQGMRLGWWRNPIGHKRGHRLTCKRTKVDVTKY